MARPDTNSRQKKGQMNVEIERGESRYVSIKVGSNTYLFERSDYNELFHAILQNPADDVVWASCVTADMVRDPEDSGNLIDELNDFVAGTVMEYGRDECDHAVTRPLNCDACETCTEIVCVECGESVVA